MSYIACIKDKHNTFEIESATWFVYAPKLCYTINRVGDISFVEMVDKVVDETIRRYLLNKGNVREFLIEFGMLRNIKIKITFNKDITSAIYTYKHAVLYVLIMLAFVADENTSISELDFNEFAIVREKINSSDLIVWN